LHSAIVAQHISSTEAPRAPTQQRKSLPGIAGSIEEGSKVFVQRQFRRGGRETAFEGPEIADVGARIQVASPEDARSGLALYSHLDRFSGVEEFGDPIR
jgi:hypothetical protein